MAFPKIHHPPSELLELKSVGSEDLPELKLLATTGKGAHELSFSLSLKEVLGKIWAFKDLKYKERES